MRNKLDNNKEMRNKLDNKKRNEKWESVYTETHTHYLYTKLHIESFTHF